MSNADLSQPDAVKEALRNNYNVTGVAVMQAMYFDDYLSLGGTDSTDVLAQHAGISARSEVLDVGCGVGGPALRLAQICGCHVTGVDLVESSIEIAREKARERGLAARTSFEVADATALPFPDGSFDVVFGQDAWCHVPDKRALLAECARVLRPGGVVAFTDWLRLGEGGDEATQVALQAALSVDAATKDEYVAILSAHGFEQLESEDLSQRFTDAYRDIYARLRSSREQLVEQFSERVFDIVAEMNGKILAGFEQGRIGGGRFVARKAG